MITLNSRLTNYSYLHTHNGPVADPFPTGSLDEGFRQLLITANGIEIRCHSRILVEVAALWNAKTTIRIVCGTCLSTAVILNNIYIN